MGVTAQYGFYAPTHLSVASAADLLRPDVASAVNSSVLIDSSMPVLEHVCATDGMLSRLNYSCEVVYSESALLARVLVSGSCRVSHDCLCL